jgi:hypothetical protein
MGGRLASTMTGGSYSASFATLPGSALAAARARLAPEEIP